MNNSNEDSDTTEKELPPFPKRNWMFIAFGVWLACGLTPLILVFIGSNYFSIADSKAGAVAGSIGDAFGLANSFFSAAALLFVIWSIRLQQQEIKFARNEWKENTRSQNEQVKMMREATTLTAINHIYSHYSPSYGANDNTGILSAVAEGHRKWAIRASFSSIDNIFEQDRSFEVEREMSQLAELLMVPQPNKDYFCQIGTRVSNLLLDQRSDAEFRKSLWTLYEILRVDPGKLIDDSSIIYSAFRHRAVDVVSAWKLLPTKRTVID